MAMKACHDEWPREGAATHRTAGELVTSGKGRTFRLTAALRAWRLAAVASAAAAMPAPAPAQTAPGTARAEPTMRWDFRNAPVGDVLSRFAETFDVMFVSQGPVPGKVTFIGSSRANYSDSCQLLSTALEPLGYSLAESPLAAQGHRVFHLKTLAHLKASQIPVYRGRDPAKVEVSDRVITQIIDLDVVEAARLRPEPPGLAGSFPDGEERASRQLVITDTAAKIHRLLEIIEKMDTSPAPQSVLKRRRLDVARAADVAKAINEQAGPPGAGGRAYADADPRTNTLIVTGPAELVERALGVVADADRAAGARP
jgi:hypothetical protein